jgi:hypothetical protein
MKDNTGPGLGPLLLLSLLAALTGCATAAQRQAAADFAARQSR